MSLRAACTNTREEKFDDELSLFFLGYMKTKIKHAILVDEPTVTFDVREGESLSLSLKWNGQLSSSEISRRVRIIGHFLEEIGVPYTYRTTCGVDPVITIFTHHLFL